MPTVQEVHVLSHNDVCTYLVRIRKSIYKGCVLSKVYANLNCLQARQYLKMIVERHHVNNRIVELENQLTD